MDGLFILCGGLGLLAGILSLQRGRDLATLLHPPKLCDDVADVGLPRVSVLAPCCGIDRDFEAHVQALLAQVYPSYEVLFLVESTTDPAWGVLSHLLADVPPSRASLLVTGPGKACGQKLHNLLMGLRHVGPHTTVFAFVDSDVQVHPQWLRALVTPLHDRGIGATAGFRWYVPLPGSLAGSLRSAWNASTLALVVHPRYGFAWGGSMAIRRQVFEELRIGEAWSQGLSDDWILTQVLRSVGLPIRFVPDCLVPTREPCTWRGLAEWTTRQGIITRVYAPETWRVALLLHSAYLALALLGLMALLTGRWMAGGALLSHWVFSGLGSAAVCRAAVHRLGIQGFAIAQRTWPQALWGPAVTALIVVNLAISGVARTIRWRGISYTMLAPGHVLVQRDT